MMNKYVKISLTVVSAILMAGQAQAADKIPVAGIGDYIYSGSNLRSTPNVDGNKNLFAPAKNVNAKFASQLAYTGKVVSGKNTRSGKAVKFYELRVVGQQKRVYVAQSRVPKATQSKLRTLHDNSYLAKVKGTKGWRCSSAENLDLAENAKVKNAFTAPNFHYNKIYKSKNKTIQPDNVTDHQVEIMVTQSGVYKYRRRGKQKFGQIKMAFCSDGKLQVARFFDQGKWKHFTLGKVGSNLPPSKPVANKPAVVKPVVNNPGSALPRVQQEKPTIIEWGATNSDADLPRPTAF